MDALVVYELGFQPSHTAVACACRFHLSFRVCPLLNPVLNTGAFFYDFLLTLPDEIQLVWRSPFNLASFPFLVIRYGTLADIAMSLLLVAKPPETAGVVMTDERYILSSVL